MAEDHRIDEGASRGSPPNLGGWPGQGPWQSPGAWPAQGPWQSPHPAPRWTTPTAQWGMPQSYPPGGWGYPPPFAPPVLVPPGPEPGLAWGGIGARFGALIIDAIIVVGALFVAGFAMSAFGTATSSGEAESPAATALSMVWLLFMLTYHPVFWYLFGATPGQKVLGLRVAQASTGESLDISAVLVRYVIFTFVTLAIPLGIISAVMASQDPFKRAWHDQVARSIVVGRR